ncbi:hypothetical protein [Streptomyces sp. NPDC017993]|uniref:hypothetical protein n=1 Tax=Streptomyces sp. NPDC017993 TaxID=3365027 RepID=UPI0037B4C91F
MSTYCEQTPLGAAPWTDGAPARPASTAYRATTDYTLAPPRAEDRLATASFPAGYLVPAVYPSRLLSPPRPEDRVAAGPHTGDIGRASRPETCRPSTPPPADHRYAYPEHRQQPPRRDDLAPPHPEARRQPPVSTPDRRRLEMQAALTAAGVAPMAGDGAAVHRLAQLDDATVGAVIRWIGAAAQRPSWPRPQAV